MRWELYPSRYANWSTQLAPGGTAAPPNRRRLRRCHIVARTAAGGVRVDAASYGHRLGVCRVHGSRASDGHGLPFSEFRIFPPLVPVSSGLFIATHGILRLLLDPS